MSTHPQYRIRRACPADIEQAVKMFSDEGWKIPKYLIQYFIESPTHSFLVAVADDGKVLGTCVASLKSDGSYFICAYLVHVEYRGLGIGKAVWKTLWDTLPETANVTLFGVLNMIERYKQIGFPVEGHLFTSYTTTPTIPTKPFSGGLIGEDIMELKDIVNREILECYDNTICPVPRTERIRCLFENSYKLVLAVQPDTKTILGYGSIIHFTNGYGIGPLYADSDVIARGLARYMINAIPRGQPVTVNFPNHCQSAADMWAEYGFGLADTDPSFSCMQLSTKRNYLIPYEKVYAMTGLEDSLV